MNTETVEQLKDSPWNQASRELRCDHSGEVRLTTFTASNRTVHVWKQCLSCGDQIGVVKRADLPRGTLLSALPPFDDQIKQRWINAVRVRMEEIRGVHAVQRREVLQDFRDEEAEFLESPAWAETRRLVLRRAGGVCEGCLSRPATQVHHLNYTRKFGREMLFDLRAVCRACHDAIHDPNDKRPTP